MTNPLLALKDDPAGRSLGLELSAGRLIDGTMDGTWPEPLLWCAVDDAFGGSVLAEPKWQRAGLYPVFLEAAEEGEPGHLWDEALWPENSSSPDSFNVEETLRSWWSECADAPWPGLAPRREWDKDEDPVETASATAEGLIDFEVLDTPRLALVPVTRGADVLPAIGWTGPVNHGSDMAPFAAVLRSWEERFGIRVVALGFDTLRVSVAAPPRTAKEARAIAAEHLAFCPDNITQGWHHTFDEYARSLVDRHQWAFWWD
ncbi:DUF4253 domain-containing protein [Streptomyces sp. NPDC048483]|uniref:DUF4253 domain-containing protein n=1 Tax=Streptomyces sp. NPDC048483 TaxID=3154927 RepID=UPI003419B24E